MKLARKAAVMSVAAGILAMGVLGFMAVPVMASGSDPTYYLDCGNGPSAGPGTYNLVEGITPAAAACAPASTVTASGTAVTAYTVGSTSNGVIYIDSAVAVTGTYTLVDCGSSATCATSVNLASGSFSGTGTTNVCHGANSILMSGTGNAGAKVATGDILLLTLNVSPAVGICSGGTTGGALTPTQVSTVAAVPEFAVGTGLLIAFGLAGLLAFKRRATLLAPM